MCVWFAILILYVGSAGRPGTIMTLPTDVLFKQLTQVWENPISVAFAMWSMTLETPLDGLAAKDGSVSAM